MASFESRYTTQNEDMAYKKLEKCIDAAFYKPPPIPEATILARKMKYGFVTQG